MSLLFSALSASVTRNLRASWRLESESWMRWTAAVSGSMLKFWIVARMIWSRGQFFVRGLGTTVEQSTSAGSSSRSIVGSCEKMEYRVR